MVNGGGSGGSTGSLSFTPSSMSFTSVNGSTPGAQTLSVTANTSTSFVGTITYASGSGSWLTVSPLSGVTPTNLSVSVNPAGLAAGTYTATISFNANGFIQTVPVTLTVSTSGGGNTGNVTVTPTSLTFTTQQGSSPGAQSITVTSASGTAGVGFTVQVTAGSNWLATSANANNTTPIYLDGQRQFDHPGSRHVQRQHSDSAHRRQRGQYSGDPDRSRRRPLFPPRPPR